MIQYYRYFVSFLVVYLVVEVKRFVLALMTDKKKNPVNFKENTKNCKSAPHCGKSNAPSSNGLHSLKIFYLANADTEVKDFLYDDGLVVKVQGLVSLSRLI